MRDDLHDLFDRPSLRLRIDVDLDRYPRIPMLGNKSVFDAKRDARRKSLAERLAVSGIWFEQLLKDLPMHAIDDVVSPVGMVDADQSAKEPGDRIREVFLLAIGQETIAEFGRDIECNSNLGFRLVAVESSGGLACPAPAASTNAARSSNRTCFASV